MSNEYFQFKQFRIDQDKCAMKVTTDACILGAWTPVADAGQHVLDIGAGTGLLSLMLAQRAPRITVDAIELDAAAVQQARENAGKSPWSDRINIIEGDARTFAFAHKYDLIITNPPFFSNSLLGPAHNKNLSRHTLGLAYEDLLQIIAGNLAPAGTASVLLPYPEYAQWKLLCTQACFNEIGRLSVRHKPGAPVNRVVGIFSGAEHIRCEEHDLTIKESDAGSYTPHFTDLLSPFYLNL